MPPPAPRRRDRRAGRQAGRLYNALRRPGGRSARRPPDRQAALARLRGRYPAPPRWRRVVLGGLAVSVAVLTVQAAVESRHRVPLEDDRAGYAALVAALEADCHEWQCGYGVGMDRVSPTRSAPPVPIRTLMSRLRLYTASYHTGLAEARVTGRLWREPMLWRSSTPTPEQRRTRERLRAFDTRPAASRPPPVLVPLGGGWYRAE